MFQFSSEQFRLKVGLAEMLKGGVIMDVTNAEQAKIAEDAGASAVMALERVPSDIRKAAIVNHYNVQPVFDVYANIDPRDLGSVGSAVEKIVGQMSAKLPRGTTLEVRGQVTTMENSFYRLGFGMIFAVVLVYLLMAINFQSWLDPFIILMALPGALAGIVWILFVTQTTFSVP